MPLKRRIAADGKCRAATKAGRQCAAPAIRGGIYCALHSDPKKAAELGRKGGARNRKIYVDAEQEVSAPTSVGEVKKMLAETMAGVRSGTIDPKIGTTVAYVAAALLRAYEAEPPVPPERPSIYTAMQFRTPPSKKELSYVILDVNTGLPVNRDTVAHGTRSATAVHEDEDLQDAETEAHKAQTA